MCEQLLKDIIAAGTNESASSYSLGSVVFFIDTVEVETAGHFQVIDGHQRLATVTLLLTALSKTLAKGEVLSGLSENSIRERFLLDDGKEGNEFKLTLTGNDNLTLRAIICGEEVSEQSAGHSQRIMENYDFFVNSLQDTDLQALCLGLEKLTIVEVLLDLVADNPQLIFESINATDREKSQADAIRSFILTDFKRSSEDASSPEPWIPVEIAFGQELTISTDENQ